MSKKTSTKAPAKKTSKAKAPKAKPEAKVVEAKSGECPKGGDHEWTDEDGEAYCSKCKEPKAAKAKGSPKKPKAEKPAKEKKLSAIDAAAKLLSDTGEPMNCKTLIETMAAKGLWTSPGGATPHATLYSAIIREIKAKGSEARFVKSERGKFARAS